MSTDVESETRGICGAVLAGIGLVGVVALLALGVQVPVELWAIVATAVGAAVGVRVVNAVEGVRRNGGYRNGIPTDRGL